MKILDLYRDYSIPHATEGHKHCRPGWVQTPCPFCTGNPGMHLGYNLDENHFYCWRCGHHFPDRTIAKLLHIRESDARDLIKKYGGINKRPKATDAKVKINLHPFKFPEPIGELTERHKKYLIKRNFDPDAMTLQWGLKATGAYAFLTDENKKVINYKHRIIAPVYWDGKIVTFQGRDITDHHMLKYMACPKSRETIHHKHILYGKQEYWTTTGIIVEGITDVWRLGVRACATFGIEYTPQQLRLMAKSFKRAAVIFDGRKGDSEELQAELKAKSLISELRFRGVDAFRVNITGDPGDMPQKEADYLIKQF